MKLNFIVCCLILLAGCTGLCKTDMGPANTFNAADEAFMPEVAHTNTGEIYLAQIALATSVDTTIRALATEILTAHQNAQSELTALNIGGRPLPADTAASYLQNAQYLPGLNAASFDTAYLNIEMHNYPTSIALYQHELEQGKFIAVKDYTEKYLSIFTQQSGMINAAFNGLK